MVVAGAEVVGVGDVNEGAVGVTGEDVFGAEPGQEGALGVVGGAVYVEENLAALPVVVGAGSHSSSSDCIPADSDCFFSSIKWNPPGTDGIEI